MAGSVPRPSTWVTKRPGVRRLTGRAEDDGHPVRAPQGQLVADGLLEPLPPGLRSVEYAGVRELELAEGELVAVATLALGEGERAGKLGLPATQEALHILVRPQARADVGEGALVRGQERKPLPSAVYGDTPRAPAWALARSRPFSQSQIG